MGCLALLNLCACAGLSPASVYEGVRDRARADTAGQSAPVERLPDYDSYQKERAKAKGL
jgi:hypothetical protein